MRIPLVALLLTTLSGALIACTVVNTTTPNPNANNNAKADGGGSDGGDESDGGAPAGAANSGSVTISQTKTEIAGQTSVSYSIVASFAKVEGATSGTPGTSPCTTTTEGSCVVQECDLTQAGGGGNAEAGTPKIVNVSAGDITVKATEEVTLTPDAENKYELKSGTTELFAGGEDISVTAKGATIPAFDQTLKAPSTFTLTTPAAPNPGEKVAVDSGGAFDFEWTDGTEGTINATLMTMNTGEKSVTVTCSFQAKDNKGTVPAAAVGKLIKGATLGTYSVGAASATTTKAGDWTVSISASAGGASGQIDVQ